MASWVSAHPRHDVVTEHFGAGHARGTACLPRRAGEWFSRGLRLDLATESDGCQRLRSGATLPGLDEGDLCDRSQLRNAGMISLAKSRICFSNKSGVSSL